MDTEQLFLALDEIADALELLILSGVEQLFQNLLVQIERILSDMPTGTIEAELYYRWAARVAIEQAMIPLNDYLYQLTLDQLLGATNAIRRALNQYELLMEDPPVDPDAFAAAVEVVSIPLRELFRRRSPSPFMRMLLRVVDAKVRQEMMRPAPRGFGTIVYGRTDPTLRPNRRDLATIQSGMRKVLTANTAAAVWDSISYHTSEVWPDRSNVRWKWITRLDEMVCPVCRPLDGVVYDNFDDAPPWPRHPRCRCVLLPIFPD